MIESRELLFVMFGVGDCYELIDYLVILGCGGLLIFLGDSEFFTKIARDHLALSMIVYKILFETFEVCPKLLESDQLLSIDFGQLRNPYLLIFCTQLLNAYFTQNLLLFRFLHLPFVTSLHLLLLPCYCL